MWDIGRSWAENHCSVALRKSLCFSSLRRGHDVKRPLHYLRQVGAAAMILFMSLPLSGCGGQMQNQELYDQLTEIMKDEGYVADPYYHNSDLSEIICPLVDKGKLDRLSSHGDLSIESFDYPEGDKNDPAPRKTWVLRLNLGIMHSRELTIALYLNDGTCKAMAQTRTI